MDNIKEKIRIEVTRACASTWKNAITEWEKFAKPFRIFKGAKCV